MNVQNSLMWSGRKPQSNPSVGQWISQVESEALPTAALDCFQGNRRLDWLINESCQSETVLWGGGGAEPLSCIDFHSADAKKH